ncbi:MAG: TetR/AcrR family transcriptional regulator [Gammaproteobacteria bacterium]|nr:TetR/AcrR family transcriptional regulator [Gammaproteobacteria bacterium]
MAKNKTYHKENLRQDLVDAGRAYVEAHGHVSLSVRTLAQKVGVSAGAPYHHFSDRRLLLLAIASEGFRILTLGASRIGASDLRGRDKLIALGLHFIDFADRSPRMFELMYESEITTPKQPAELEQYHRIGQQLIQSAIASELRRAAPRSIAVRALAFWAFVYGFAALRRVYVIHSFDRFRMSRDAVARSIVTQAATAALAR